MSSQKRSRIDAAIARNFDDPTYSDLTIKSGTKLWNVHRVIVCTQSKPLHAACMGGFKETEIGIIDLSDDDEFAVETMLRFLYTGECQPSAEPTDMSLKLRLPIHTYILADQYDVPDLMVATANKFQIALQQQLTPEEFLDLIPHIYDVLTPTNPFIPIALEYAERDLKNIIKSPGPLLATLNGTPQFALDLLKMSADNLVQGFCSHCNSTQKAEILQARCMKCSKGGLRLSNN